MWRPPHYLVGKENVQSADDSASTFARCVGSRRSGRAESEKPVRSRKGSRDPTVKSEFSGAVEVLSDEGQPANRQVPE
jgi:hypothetical protein